MFAHVLKATGKRHSNGQFQKTTDGTVYHQHVDNGDGTHSVERVRADSKGNKTSLGKLPYTFSKANDAQAHAYRLNQTKADTPQFPMPRGDSFPTPDQGTDGDDKAKKKRQDAGQQADAQVNSSGSTFKQDGDDPLLFNGGLMPVLKADKHPGFQAAAQSIAARQGVSMDSARAILGAGAHSASPAAKKRNPRLKRV